MDDPQYQQKSKEWDKSYALYRKYVSPPVLTMHLRESGFFNEEKRPSTGVENTLKDGNVLILDDETNSKGSGFLTTAPDGTQVVVTAAHVVAGNDLHKVTVENKNNQAAGVTGGCYVYEEDGKFADLLEGETTDVDLAILSLGDPLAGTPLELAKGFPERGTWLAFVNNQGDYEPDYPASYSGFAVSQLPGTLGNMAMTGVQPWRKDIGGGKSYAIHEGGSGCLVAGMNGQVVGITYTASTGYWEAGNAENVFGVRFDHPVGAGNRYLACHNLNCGSQ